MNGSRPWRRPVAVPDEWHNRKQSAGLIPDEWHNRKQSAGLIFVESGWLKKTI